MADKGDALARRLFFVSIVLLAVAYGIGASEYRLFPVPLLKDVRLTAKQMMEDAGATLPWYFQRSSETTPIRVHAADALAPGLRLINGLTRDEKTAIKVIDVRGRTVHRWLIDWFAIWADATHLPEEVVPKSNAPPVQGVALAANGDLIFNFEELGMVRLDACGAVVWRLPYRTHHSIHLDDAGNIWAPGVISRKERRANLPNHAPPFSDYTIVQVSPAGRILQELSIADLLRKNHLNGLLYMSSTANRSTRVTGDTLHLNDVETFPASMAPGRFMAGDIMISLRNVNAILVFDSNRRVKYMSVGAVVRQHDPDFADGNTISVFDNNNVSGTGNEDDIGRPGNSSRIVTLSASTDDVAVRFSGRREQPFYTDIMGTHQLLPNGNILLVESVAGRVVEVTRSGDIAWEYVNLIDESLVGLVGDALVLPSQFDEAFFATVSARCSSATTQN